MCSEARLQVELCDRHTERKGEGDGEPRGGGRGKPTSRPTRDVFGWYLKGNGNAPEKFLQSHVTRFLMPRDPWAAGWQEREEKEAQTCAPSVCPA